VFCFIVLNLFCIDNISMVVTFIVMYKVDGLLLTSYARCSWKMTPVIGLDESFDKPIAGAAWSKARTVFARSNTGIVGSNPS
jgi:hypothetical protein